MQPSGDIIRFGEFTLDRGTRQLFRAGAEVHLSPKAFELLLILLAERPRAVSKADLHAQLWPDAFVSEANLFGLVKEIRHALGDDSRQARFIRTLHRFGYAFGETAEGVSGSSRRRPSNEATYWILADRPIQLLEGPNVLGRDPQAEVWFDRPGVSRRHARIVVTAGGATLEDLGSTNGTWVGGSRIDAPTALRDGDEIKLGPVVVTFRMRRTPASTEVVP